MQTHVAVGAPYRRKLSVHVVPAYGKGSGLGEDEADGGGEGDDGEEDGGEDKRDGVLTGKDSTPGVTGNTDDVDGFVSVPQVRTPVIVVTHVHVCYHSPFSLPSSPTPLHRSQQLLQTWVHLRHVSHCSQWYSHLQRYSVVQCSV